MTTFIKSNNGFINLVEAMVKTAEDDRKVLDLSDDEKENVNEKRMALALEADAWLKGLRADFC